MMVLERKVIDKDGKRFFMDRSRTYDRDGGKNIITREVGNATPPYKRDGSLTWINPSRTVPDGRFYEESDGTVRSRKPKKEKPRKGEPEWQDANPEWFHIYYLAYKSGEVDE